MTHTTPRAARRSARRALTTTIALAAAGLVLAPGSAFAAGGVGGPVGPAGPGGPGGSGAGSTAPAPETPGPKAPGPKVPAPGSKTPGHKTPGPKAPGSKTPGSKTPGSKTSQTPAPKPSSGPLQTVTKLVTTKVPTAARPVTISARVSPAHRGGPGTPAETGTVVFTVDGTASAPIPVAKNRASEKLKLTAGKHTVSAKYSGDGAHAASESGAVTVTVN
jgi:hypothetical protein